MKFTVVFIMGIFSSFSLPVLANDSFEIFIVRHAEKLESEPAVRDPKLSECGEGRAQALIDELTNKPLVAIYATEYQRTQLTAAPIAEYRRLHVETYAAREYQQLAQKLVERAQNALVVGHSNTAPMIVNALADTSLAALPEDKYDMLYRVRFTSGGVEVSEQIQVFECETSNAQLRN